MPSFKMMSYARGRATWGVEFTLANFTDSFVSGNFLGIVPDKGRPRPPAPYWMLYIDYSFRLSYGIYWILINFLCANSMFHVLFQVSSIMVFGHKSCWAMWTNMPSFGLRAQNWTLKSLGLVFAEVQLWAVGAGLPVFLQILELKQMQKTDISFCILYELNKIICLFTHHWPSHSIRPLEPAPCI